MHLESLGREYTFAKCVFPTENSWDYCSVENKMETTLIQRKNRTMSGPSLVCIKLGLYSCKEVNILSWFPNIFDVLFCFTAAFVYYCAKKHTWKNTCLQKCSPVNECELTQTEPSLAFALTKIVLREMYYLSKAQNIHLNKLSSIHLLGAKAEPSNRFHTSVM